VKRTKLTNKEKRVLLGLTSYPNLNDSELATLLNIKLSTLTAIKRRLDTQVYYQSFLVPQLNNLGCELMAVIYTQFNPVIPLEQRIQNTKKFIEISDEIIFSIGEQEKGFSLNLSQNYTNIGRINEIRTETFGKLGLLEKEYPNEVIFPFETSSIIRFLDLSRILSHIFGLITPEPPQSGRPWFHQKKSSALSEKQKKVYKTLVEYPTDTTQQIGEKVGLSRHTISRMKKQFLDEGLLRQIVFPNMKKIGFELLTLYHIKFSPHKAPTQEEIMFLDSPSTIFLATRTFETVLISVYPTYQDYKDDEMQKIRFLKEHDLISIPPFISTYSFERMVIIKNLDFLPITKKTLNIE
jgi:DNA-binding MarR family transcriptional regulator